MGNWRPITDFPGYEVSDQGEVRSLARMRVNGRKSVCAVRPRRKSLVVMESGHLQTNLWKDNVVKWYLVHRLVLEAFVGPCPEGMECRHLDGNPANNKLENLCWGTRKENRADSIRHGTFLKGERHPLAKLTVLDVEKIRQSSESNKNLAAQFKVNPSTISRVRSGKRYV